MPLPPRLTFGPYVLEPDNLQLWREGESVRLTPKACPEPSRGGQGPESEAEECFWKAIKVARKQQAKSWELRATHHETRPRLVEAHQMLSEVYGWFTEGFDTVDLQEAKAPLAELSH